MNRRMTLFDSFRQQSWTTAIQLRRPPPTDSGTRKPQQVMKVFGILLKGTPKILNTVWSLPICEHIPTTWKTPQPKGREKSSSNEAAFSWATNQLGTLEIWSFNPFWKICSSNWIISPRFGVKIKTNWNHHLVNRLRAKQWNASDLDFTLHALLCDFTPQHWIWLLMILKRKVSKQTYRNLHKAYCSSEIQPQR